MLESEVKKLRESVDELNDNFGKLIQLLSDPPSSPAVVEEMCINAPEEKSPVNLAPISLEDANARLGQLAMQMNDNGMMIRKAMQDRYGTTKLSEVDPVLLPHLITYAESLVEPAEAVNG